MVELKEYVDGLFQNQQLTPEIKDLKEEILSNMLAKKGRFNCTGTRRRLRNQKSKGKFIYD